MNNRQAKHYLKENNILYGISYKGNFEEMYFKKFADFEKAKNWLNEKGADRREFLTAEEVKYYLKNLDKIRID